ncbi:MAG: hypothetical protein JSV66_11015 [Trueperaceae bacterium]|nr:MAG: hypothetical protein JSV66_11015 [Trueperaceae bacterium]
MSNPKREMLRHFLATIAYRAQKVLRGAPGNYPDLLIGSGVRSPLEIVHHMRGLAMFTHSHFRPYESTHPPYLGWEEEVAGFHQVLAELDADLASDLPLLERSYERLLQGPLADIMTHVGQLAMLRRLAGSSVPAENFSNAEIRSGRVGSDQPDPADPD